LARRRLTTGGSFALVFHGVTARPIPAAPGRYLSADDLRRVLAWLADRFALLAPHDFVTSRRPGILLTFDDGLANNVSNALPVLAEFGAPAVLFVATQHVSDPRNWLPDSRALAATMQMSGEDLRAELFDGMSADQLRQCGAHPLVTVGSHTVSHPRLSTCSDDELRHELAESRRLLAELSGQPVDLFAYPKGDYDRRVAEAVRAAGYRAAFAVDARGLAPPDYEIPRIGIYHAGPAYLGYKLSGLHRRPFKNPGSAGILPASRLGARPSWPYHPS
jgi:peptidoglycan/xylan/chitin deacetylase (PgdA/CDA1 family)